MIGLLILMQLNAEAGTPELAEVMISEMERSVDQLQLDEMGPPWRISLDLVDIVQTHVVTDFGALMDERTQDVDHPTRYLRAEVRQGGPEYDSGDYGGGRNANMERLPTDLAEDYFRRKIWLQVDKAYKSAVAGFTRKKVALAPEDADRPAVAPAQLPQSMTWPELSLDHGWVRELTLDLSGVLRDYPGLEQGRAEGAFGQARVLSVSTEGLRLNRIYPELVFRVQAKIRAKDGSLLQNSRSWVARDRDELPAKEAMLSDVREMADWLIQASEAEVLEDYIGPVLFKQQASVEFFRQLAMPEILGSPPPVEARNVNSSRPAQPPRVARIGRRLLPAGWSLVDDATEQGVGHYLWDYEGVAPRSVQVIEDGILREALMSRIPLNGNSLSTGHGRSSGASRRVAMPARVTIRPPRSVSERRLERLALRQARALKRDSVLVVRHMEPLALLSRFEIYFSGDEVPAGLTSPTEAYLLYRDGRRVPVRSSRFLGVDRRAMRDIIAAGRPNAMRGVMDRHPSEMRYSLGWTSGLQSGWSTPSILVSELELVSRPGGVRRILSVAPNSP